METTKSPAAAKPAHNYRCRLDERNRRGEAGVMSILDGIRIIEFEGIGPGPFCGMHMADLGADVILIERPQNTAPLIDNGPSDILKRGKRSVALDLKSQEGRTAALALVKEADGVIEGMRPGVMERLGLGPDDCLGVNPSLVYGRITGWGQSGPLARAAGHDINYLALSGALWYAGQPDAPPFSPPTLVGDIGGGALYLTIGLLAGIMRARENGKGDVVDAAIVDGAAHMSNLLLNIMAGGQMTEKRGQSLLDGPHWYQSYVCADGEMITLGALEPKFYRELLMRLELDDDPAFQNQYDPKLWPQQRLAFADLFRTKTSEEWRALLEGTDVCFAPILPPSRAAKHPHMAARNCYYEAEGVLQARPAPRFSASPAAAPRPAPTRGQHNDELL